HAATLRLSAGLLGRLFEELWIDRRIELNPLELRRTRLLPVLFVLVQVRQRDPIDRSPIREVGFALKRPGLSQSLVVLAQNTSARPVDVPAHPGHSATGIKRRRLNIADASIAARAVGHRAG